MKVKNTISPTLEICLRIFGVWPNTSFVLLRRLFWTFAVVLEQVLQYRYVIMHFHSIELFEIMSILCTAVSYTLLLVKLIIFWYKQRTFNRILTMMAIDWEKCSEFSMLIMTYNAKLSQRFANMSVILYSSAIIIFSSQNIIKHMDETKTSNVSSQVLILQMDLPFNANERFAYESVMIVQFLHLIICGNALGLLNAILINLILHIGGQIDILRENLMEIFSKKTKGPSDITVKKVINTHQNIITFSEHIEDLYSYIAMVMFVLITLIICCLGFTIVGSIGRPDASKTIIKNLLFYIVMNMEAFLFCFAGEYLSVKSESIADAAYASLWYESDFRSSQIILLLLMRSQYQLTITIGKIMNLSLERFSGIIRASVSYVSVLFAIS